jgi:hypothetical protein
MFHSWLDAVVFGVITSFLTGILVSVFTKVNVNKMDKKSV